MHKDLKNSTTCSTNEWEENKNNKQIIVTEIPFEVVKSYDFKQKIHLRNREDTLNLLKMTPHFYHIKKERRHVLDTLEDFDVTIDIRVTVYSSHEIYSAPVATIFSFIHS